jgi:hypothetical protein
VLSFWIVCFTSCAAGSQGADLSHEWKRVPLKVYTADGNGVSTDVFEFIRTSSPQARTLRSTLETAARDLPADRLEPFLRGLTLPGMAMGNGKAKELAREWVIHLSPRGVFLADMEYIGADTAFSVFNFLHYPPLNDEQRRTLADQLQRVLDGITGLCASVDLDMARVRESLEEVKRYQEIYNRPGRFGHISVPRSPQDFDRLMAELPDVFGKEALTRETQEDLTDRVVTYIAVAFHDESRTRTPQRGSKEYQLERAFMKAIEKQLDVVSSQPHSTSAPSVSSRPADSGSASPLTHSQPVALQRPAKAHRRAPALRWHAPPTIGGRQSLPLA